MTLRIETRTGEMVSEIVASRTELLWDAFTDSGKVRFHMERITTLDGELISREPAGLLERSFDLLMARDWVVPVGPEETVTVPTVLLMGTIKVAFDTLFNEHFSTPPEEPTP